VFSSYLQFRTMDEGCRPIPYAWCSCMCETLGPLIDSAFWNVIIKSTCIILVQCVDLHSANYIVYIKEVICQLQTSGVLESSCEDNANLWVSLRREIFWPSLQLSAYQVAVSQLSILSYTLCTNDKFLSSRNILNCLFTWPLSNACNLCFPSIVRDCVSCLYKTSSKIILYEPQPLAFRMVIEWQRE
jgi:hypothetical protein